MKYILIAAVAIVAVAATGGGYACYLNQTKSAYVIMVDITDDTPSNIDTSEVPKHIAQKSSEWAETDIRVSTFSNFRNNKIAMLTIPAQFPLLGNPEQRKRKLQIGYRQILDTLDNFVSSDTGRSQSVIYAPMAEQLNWLADITAHTKEAFFYSDCQQNTNAFSLYKSSDVQQVINDPGRVKAYFEKQVSLHSLKGITVYFIYNAPTPLVESRFILMANLWGEIFKAHGATYVIGTNLSTN